MQAFSFQRAGVLLALILALTACTASRPLPDDGFVAVPGGRVAFRISGESAGVPILVIHGGPGGTACDFASTMQGVGAHRPVVTYDQLGSGNSDRMLDVQRDAVLSRFVDEVVAIRKQLGLTEVHLLGHSWGAAIALEYLLTADSTGVRSVSFMGPLLSTPRWIQDANVLVRDLPEEAQAAIRKASASEQFETDEFQAANKLFESRFLIRTPEDQLNLPYCDSTPQGFNVELYEYMWGPSEFLATGTLRDFDRVGRLTELTMPVMFLVGEFDEARPETVRDYQALVPRSVVKVIPGSGHSVNIDQTELFNQAVVDFLRSVDSGDGSSAQ